MRQNHFPKLVAAALLLVVCGISSDHATADDEPVIVKGGLVTVIQERNIAARETGLISKVHFKAGEFIDADSVLAELDSTQAQLKLAEARIQYDKALEAAKSDVETRAARKALEVSRAELARAQKAFFKVDFSDRNGSTPPEHGASGITRRAIRSDGQTRQTGCRPAEKSA